MLQLRKSGERGHANHGWLDTRHSFSFAEYYDPSFMGFRSLRVINQDRIAAGAGFPPHPHRDMEIITYVTRGTIAHQDSLGHASKLAAGEIQVMAAGRGVVHSEFNASTSEPLELLQIWIVPSRAGLAPGYAQRPVTFRPDAPTLLVAGADDASAGDVLRINQDARVYAVKLGAGKTTTIPLAKTRFGWVQVVAGELTVNGATLSAGDGLAAAAEDGLSLTASTEVEALVFDLA